MWNGRSKWNEASPVECDHFITVHEIPISIDRQVRIFIEQEFVGQRADDRLAAWKLMGGQIGAVAQIGIQGGVVPIPSEFMQQPS